jgi:WD40 repeat protein/transcriptional regulator with XRE-family HTH domain
MSEQRRYKVTDDRFGRRALTLREKAGLTQAEVAQTLGVSKRTIQYWESGTSFPGAANLKQLIELLLQHTAFHSGRERDEAEQLWVQADESAGQRRSLFDAQWFDTLLARRGAQATRSPEPTPPPVAPQRVDWGEAPDVSAFCGREAELATLTRWVLTDRCRVVALLGIGGMGKTTLAIRAAQLVVPHFASLCWRSLRDAPPLLTLLDDCLRSLAVQPTSVSLQSVEHGIGLLLERLREARCLLILDNLETIFEAGSLAGHYREEHAKYRLLFQRLAETPHQSCVLLTSRELLRELEPLEGAHSLVRALKLGGLQHSASLELLKDKVLFGPEQAWERFVQHYAGNPLALKIAAATVRDLFDGDLVAYLSDTPGVLISLQQLLSEHIARLTPTERDLLTWLAVEREGATLEQFAADLYPAVPRRELIAALQSLRQRSLVERSGSPDEAKPGQGVSFTLLPVVMEQVSDGLVTGLVEELRRGSLGLLTRYALMQSQSADYIRDSQQRMLVQPILELLLARFGDREQLAAQLRAMLHLLRGMPQTLHGYAGGNLLNLLVVLQGHLRNENCSHLALHQAYLVGVEAQDATFAGADVSKVRFTEPLEPLATMALSGDGRLLAVGSFTGQIRLWNLADGKPLWSDHRPAQTVLALAFSGDGAHLVSGDAQGQLRLWEAPSGRCLRTIESVHSWIYAVAFSFDTTSVASSGDEGVIRIWKLTDGTCQQTFQSQQGRVWSLSFSPNGALLVSSGSDGTVRIWDTASWECVRVLEHATERVIVKAALHPDGLVVASCGEEDGLIKLWGVHSGECLITRPRHTIGQASIAFNQDGTVLASGSSAGMVELWEVGGVAGLSPLKLLQAHRKFVSTIAFAQHNRLASASYAGRVKLWDVRSGKLLTTFQGYSRVVNALSFTPASDRLVLGDNNGLVQRWDIASGRCLSSGQGHTGTVRGIAMSADGSLFATSGDDQRIVLWNSASGLQLTAMEGHTSIVIALAFGITGRLLASGSADNEIRCWRLEALSRTPVSTLLGVGPDMVTTLAFAPDGRTLASGHTNGAIWLWDVARGLCRQRLQQDGLVAALQFSADGQTLASSGNTSLSWWDVTSGRRTQTVATEENAGPVVTTVFDEGRALVVTKPAAQALELWSVTEFGEIQQIATIARETVSMREGAGLSRDGRWLALGQGDGTVVLHECSTGAVSRCLASDRPYERMCIGGATGLNDEQRAALRTLGAVENSSRRLEPGSPVHLSSP